MIDGVRVTPLKVSADDRGRHMDLLRRDDPDFQQFGQVYLTTTYPGVVKAWHRHQCHTENLVCIAGMVKVAMYDARPESPTRGCVDECFMGIWNPVRLTIPPGVYHGLKCVSTAEAMVINVPTEPFDPHRPDEQRLPADSTEIPYSWA